MDGALAEIARVSDQWVDVNPDPPRLLILLGDGRERRLREELPETWGLIDRLVATVAAAEPEQDVRLSSARLALMQPGGFMPAHHDGIDGVRWRRYQVALQSEPGVQFVCGDEPRRFLPGEAWQFDANRVHEVRNDSAADRITILVDMRVSPAAGSAAPAPEPATGGPAPPP